MLALLLPLATFFQRMGMNPWHAFGLQADDGAARVTSACNDIVLEHAWQDTQAVGREEIRDAITAAEAKLFGHLGYRVAPDFAETTLPYDQTRPWWHAVPVVLGEGYVQAIGVKARTLIVNAVPTYTDADGDGLQETFTLTVSTTVTNPDEIAVYFTAADRWDGSDVSERWRITPVRVSISGGVATIRGAKYLCVKPVLYEGVNADGLDAMQDSNFVASLAVYRRYADATTATTFTWDGCGCEPTPDPALGTTTIANGVLGIVTPMLSACSCVPCGAPAHVCIAYQAGLPLVNGQMVTDWQRWVSILAAAELGRPICSCEVANREIARWQFELNRTSGANDEAYAVSAADLDNPLGQRRGHIEVWRAIRLKRQNPGVSAG